MNGIELQVVTYLAGLLALVVSGAVTYLTPRAKKLIDAHLTAKQAVVANSVIDGLGQIADAVVHSFNQSVVNDAKANGVFNSQLAQSVKQDAVNAVKAQGAPLLALGMSVFGDIDSLVSNLVEKSVVKAKN